MYHWQLDGEGCTLAKLAFHLDVAIVQINNLLDVCQSESEALHIMHIASAALPLKGRPCTMCRCVWLSMITWATTDRRNLVSYTISVLMSMRLLLSFKNSTADLSH